MPASASAAWPQELLDIAQPLYESGESAAQIALAVGHGKSRNAVIGIAHRKGWINPTPKKGGIKPGEKRPRATRARIWRASESLAPLPPEEVPKPENFLGLTIQEIASKQCRFPDGDGPFIFCGQPTQDESSYCAYHKSICWIKPDRRPDRQFTASQKF